MKKSLAMLLALVMLFALCACGQTAAPAAPAAPAEAPAAPAEAPAAEAPAEEADPYADLEEIELIGADSTGKGAAGQIFGEMVAANVAEITGGKFTIDYHPNGDLGGDADLLRQAQSGDIAIVVCQTAPTVSFIPEMAVFDLPMVFAKYDGAVIDEVLNGENEFNTALCEAYEAVGFHYLGIMQNATYRLTTSNSELKTLEDFAGLQIRTMENKNHMAFWSAIGAEPTPLAWAEVFQALQTGMLDAQENAADTCVGANFQDVQKYLACTNHILYANQILINSDAFNALPEAYQKALEQAVKNALEVMNPQLAQIDADNKKVLEDGGMTIIEYPAEFYDNILAQDGVKALYESIDKEQVNGLGSKLVAALEAAASGTAAPAEAPAAEPAVVYSYDDLEEIELIGADSTGKGAAGQIFGELVASKVSEITGGKFTIDYHPNGDLGGDADLLRQAQSGDIAIVVCQTAPTVSFIPEMAVFDLPMVFAKYDGAVIDEVLNGENEFNTALCEAYEAVGFHYLGIMQNATYRLTTANAELRSIADFAGLQIRTMENKNHMAFWSAIGAEPTPLAWAEVFQALQTGMLDAQENAADTCVGANFQDVQKYLACTNHILYANQILINADVFNSLPEAYQAALVQAVKEALAVMNPQLAQIDADNKKILEDGGMTIIEYPAEFYDEILALDGVKALYESIDKEQVNGLGAKLVAALEAAA